MHDVIGFGTVLLAILAGILLNRGDVRDLRAEVNALRKEMNDKFDALRKEMNDKFDALRKEMNDKFDSLRGEMHGEFERFYMTLGEHEARITNLEKK